MLFNSLRQHNNLVYLFLLYIVLLIGGTTTLAVQHEMNTNNGVAENLAGAQHHNDPQIITMDNLDEFLDKLKYADGWAESADDDVVQDYKMEKKQEDKLKMQLILINVQF